MCSHLSYCCVNLIILLFDERFTVVVSTVLLWFVMFYIDLIYVLSFDLMWQVDKYIEILIFMRSRSKSMSKPFMMLYCLYSVTRQTGGQTVRQTVKQIAVRTDQKNSGTAINWSQTSSYIFLLLLSALVWVVLLWNALYRPRGCRS